ncbi:NB-ARC domain-containing protein [Daejeonella rubra]|uniref:NB-ARC domain-containing protein n=1 Tax=Daejeonella rubra TaxID=990371 RepID=A0A1G9YXB3_9SPHI|nr:toll/interleukin-1 receptor domain-containing protein [Daejeonella rubra]SDN13325.1 NB-ARC domain-containing protein [Daejeonella rubra]
MLEKTNIFISYSHEDEIYKEKLEKHLGLLQRNGIIETWNDRKIVAGDEWDKKIKEELENSQIILLLVSVDFLSSDYCYDIEIKKAIEKHESGRARVIPIILRACDWHETPFGKLQALPKNAKPVKSFEDEDEAFYSVTEGLKLSISQLKKEIGSITPHDNSIKISYKFKVECDTPPNILHWRGRQKEISEIELDLHKVVFISGIGGQGKSALASCYVREIALKKEKWEFWDWRDCQEKENRIHTKIVSIISRITNNRIQAKEIANEKIEDLIELFFSELENRRIIFVFDNIDAYIEFENFQLTGTVLKLYKAALSKIHQSKFIFTCRSSINDIDIELLTIKLEGLSKEETFLLFSDYQLPFKNEEVAILSEKSFALTKGHPLWLNLIAAQARRGLEVAEKFILGITPNTHFNENNLTSILSYKILSVIWESLNDKQKILLMAFAEIVRAESQANLAKILASELNHNQFLKALKALKQLNLIVVKSMIDEEDTFELHPLVKEYVIQNFARVERSRFISLFVNFYDNLILVLKPKLSSDQPLSFFENWTAKVELDVNIDDYKTALIGLEEISTPICDAGHVEEYIRVASLVFITINWKTAINEEYSYFNSQFSKFVDTLTQFGKFDEASAFLTKYEKHIFVKGPNYIRFCEAKGHFLWFQSSYEDAIKLIEEGIALEEQSPTKSDLNLKHQLALALRDTKVKENVKRALEIFLNNRELDHLINHDEESFIDGEMYGNVGRCLQYMGNISDAIVCFKKSLKKVKDPMKQGYGYLWYAECLIAQNNIETALWFYSQSYNFWQKISPIKAIFVEKKIEAIVEINPSLTFILETSEKETERVCLEIIYQK